MEPRVASQFIQLMKQSSACRKICRPAFVSSTTDNMEPHEHIEQFFAYSHLPAHLQEVSKSFSELAAFVLTLPRNPERTVALRKLLEAKDAAVRAKLAVD